MLTIYLATNIHTGQMESFEWTSDDRLLIKGVSVNPRDWEINYWELKQIVNYSK